MKTPKLGSFDNPWFLSDIDTSFPSMHSLHVEVLLDNGEETMTCHMLTNMKPEQYLAAYLRTWVYNSFYRIFPTTKRFQIVQISFK